jgi:hypothetical protein
MRTGRDEVGVQDGLHDVLQPGPLPDQLGPPGHLSAHRLGRIASVRASGTQTSGRKPLA